MPQSDVVVVADFGADSAVAGFDASDAAGLAADSAEADFDSAVSALPDEVSPSAELEVPLGA